MIRGLSLLLYFARGKEDCFLNARVSVIISCFFVSLLVVCFLSNAASSIPVSPSFLTCVCFPMSLVLFLNKRTFERDLEIDLVESRATTILAAMEVLAN